MEDFRMMKRRFPFSVSLRSLLLFFQHLLISQIGPFATSLRENRSRSVASTSRCRRFYILKACCNDLNQLNLITPSPGPNTRFSPQTLKYDDMANDYSFVPAFGQVKVHDQIFEGRMSTVISNASHFLRAA